MKSIPKKAARRSKGQRNPIRKKPAGRNKAQRNSIRKKSAGRSQVQRNSIRKKPAGRSQAQRNSVRKKPAGRSQAQRNSVRKKSARRSPERKHCFRRILRIPATPQHGRHRHPERTNRESHPRPRPTQKAGWSLRHLMESPQLRIPLHPAQKERAGRLHPLGTQPLGRI